MKIGPKVKILDLLKNDGRYSHMKVFEASPNYQEDCVNINPVNP